MDNTLRVAIIIVNWNGRDDTLACLHSLRSLTYPNTEVILVDNGSSDGSVESVQHRHPEVTVLAQRENLRFAGGNNEGIRHALGAGAELLLLLNNDTIVGPDFLSFLVQRMSSEPRCGMAAPKILYHDDPQRIWYAGGIVSFWTGTLRHRGIRELDAGQYDAPAPTDYATGCCVLVRRSVVDEIGQLDPSFFMYGEDADWCLRARRAGYTVLYEPRARIWHKLSSSVGGHLSFFKLRNKFIGNFRLIARHARWYHWLTFPWMNFLVNAFAAIRYLLGSPRASKGKPSPPA